MNKSSWSLNLGCWGGVDVRLHVTLPLVMLCALLLSNDVASYRRAQFPIEHVALILLLGFAAVAIHAASHVIVAGRYGLDTPELVLAPWGEWNGIRSPHTPEAALYTQLSGVAVNGFLCALSAIWLWLAGDSSIGEMLIPLDSRLLLDNEYRLITLRWFFCINYSLVLMNLIPAAPFDGARIVKSILQLTLPHLDDARIREAVAFVGRIVGLILLVLAMGLGQGDQKGLFPAWFPLTVLGLVALFAAEIPVTAEAPPKGSPPPHTPPPPELIGDDPTGAGLLDWEEGPFAQWLEEKREFDRARRVEIHEAEISDERRVDEILTRLHEQGPQSLTAEDRVILQRVSDRLRLRKQKNK